MNEVKKIMLIGPAAVKAVSYVNFNVDEGTMGTSIREGQEIHLQSIIGSNLLYRLQELVLNKMRGEADNIDASGNTAYKEILDDYIIPYLANKIQALLCVPVSFKLRNMGVVRTNDTNINGPSLKEVMAVQTRYNTMAARYATYLSKYMCAHKNEFPELTQAECPCGCSEFVKPLIGKSFVECGLVLGNPENGCDCC